MLPSLTYLVAGNSSADSQDSSQTSDTSSDSSDSSSDDSSADAIDSRYQALVDAQQKKLDSDPNNLAALLNMGNDYMKWGVALLQASSADADTSHAYDVLDNAVATYDKYLALNDSSAVKVDRALCQYYAGRMTSTARSRSHSSGSRPLPPPNPRRLRARVPHLRLRRRRRASRTRSRTSRAPASKEFIQEKGNLSWHSR